MRTTWSRPDTTGVPRLFLHTRVAPPIFTLSGQVMDTGHVPLPDVAVIAGPHRTTTGSDGSFSFPYLVGGTYTLSAARPGYLFSPPRRTVSVLADLAHQDFIGFPGAGGDGWLDLPFAYDGTPATFLSILRDTDEGGLVDAWFDHDAPTYAKNGSILLWDGRSRTAAPYHTNLGCFERRCYDGHDGVDFPYRDPDRTTPNIYEPIAIYPAAEGRVAAVVTSCHDAGRFCNRGYGNEVLLYHDNGYFTRYSHLDTVTVDTNAGWITSDTQLGVMGSTGNAYGVHLHFAVHQDDGNGQWDGDKIDLPLDPFGWLGVEPDPWTATGEPPGPGPVSRHLWRYSPTAEAVVAESQPATLRDGSGAVTANLPAGTFAGQVARRTDHRRGPCPGRPAAAQSGPRLPVTSAGVAPSGRTACARPSHRVRRRLCGGRDAPSGVGRSAAVSMAGRRGVDACAHGGGHRGAGHLCGDRPAGRVRPASAAALPRRPARTGRRLLRRGRRTARRRPADPAVRPARRRGLAPARGHRRHDATP